MRTTAPRLRACFCSILATWKISMPFAYASQTSSDAYTCRAQGRNSPCLASQLWTRRVRLHVSAILILLSFLTFIATSSPHRVHHLAESKRSSQPLARAHHQPRHHDHHHDHPMPTGQPAHHPHEKHTPQLPACVVLFVLQSMPILGAENVCILAPIAPQPLDVLAKWFCPLAAHPTLYRARAPPLVIL
jgi:hypothetical protein